MIVYFDTSALVKAYIAEDGSSDVLALLNLPDLQPGSLLLLEVEMAAALGKAARLLRLAQDTLARAWEGFLRDWEAFARIEVSEPLVRRAAQLALEQSLRGYDSLRLASALTWQEYLGEPLTLATFDRELWQAARVLGVRPWPEGLGSR